MGELLRIQGLTSGYGKTQVLNGVDFHVNRDEILAIIGANGAGKSTLLRTISGLIEPTAGSIHFDGRDITGLSSPAIVAAGLTHAPEGRRVFSGMSVEENLVLGALRRPGKSPATVARALEEVFVYFPRLRERRRQLAGTLSGGEQQMCAIGRALMAKPKLLVVDELSLGLAPLIVHELLDVLASIQQAGCTIVLVEQDISVALSFADRAVVMQLGRVVLTGAADSLLGNEEIVKSYLGG
ncbi:MAG: ABC transporter ATP-binding protein [Burkholderiaceae bacterium]|nr:ABC transporter ATP-binding protein [Burkholderiaceae bacterium]